MKRRAVTAIAGVALLFGATVGARPASASSTAASSTPAKSAAPSASAAPSSGPSAGALPPGHPGADGAMPPGHPAVDAQMPPGHPGVDGAMPPGHPAMDGQMPPGHPGADGAAPGDDPHAGAGRMDDLFEAPPDSANDDPKVPVGTADVEVLDARGRPVENAKVTLAIQHASVAKGESESSATRTAGADGHARFDRLDTGSGIMYRAAVERGDARFSVPPFQLGDKAGKHIVLHVYESTHSLGQALVGMQGFVYVSLKEDAIQVEQLFNVFNVGAVAWVPQNVVVALPKGYKAFNKQDSSDEAQIEQVDGGVALRGTIGPGRHDLTFRYQIPLDDEARQSFRIGMPPHVAQMRVISEASKTMGLEVADFPPAERTETRDGKHVLVTDRQVSHMNGGLPEVEVTLTGLPTPPPGRWIAAALALLLVVGAIVHVARRGEEDELSDEMRRELREAREALLDEIVTLERAHKKGDVGPKTYARVRAALEDALARVVAMLDAGKRKPRRDDATDRAKASA